MEMKRGYVNNYDLTTEPLSPTHLMLYIYAYVKASTVDNQTISFEFFVNLWRNLFFPNHHFLFFFFSLGRLNQLTESLPTQLTQTVLQVPCQSFVQYLSGGITVLDTVMNVMGPACEFTHTARQ